MADVTRCGDRDGENENGLCFTLTKAVRLDQLMAELTAAMDWPEDASLVSDGDPAAAAPDNPVTVWIAREDVNVTTFERVVAQHEPSTAWSREASGGPSYEEVRAKALRGEDLTPQEQQVALRGLLGLAE